MFRTFPYALLWISLWLALAVCPGRAQQPAAAPSGPELVQAMGDSLARVIERTEPSVVAIARVKRDAPGEALAFPFRPDPFGRETVGTTPPDPTDPDFIPSEFATGVVIGPGGLILTAYHVLDEHSDFYVTTHDRKVYLARIRAADPRSDLAVLAIDARGLEPIPFGDAGTVKKGQIVVALGNPYAIARDGQASASWGIVSNLGRKAPPVSADAELAGRATLHQYGTLIQTDAKLNLGTSGGPLLNLQGEMIGLATALAATPGYERSAGYAMPVDATFRRAVARLEMGREVEYGFLGISPTHLQPEEVLRGQYGCRVNRVWPGTPAERAGLRTGDIIITVDQTPVHDANDLMLAVGRLPAGATARLAILRDDRRRQVDVALTKYHVRGRKIVTDPGPTWRGLEVDYPTAVVDPVEWKSLATPFANFDDGVIVTRVDQGSPAWDAGLRPRQVISHVERTRVHNPEEFRAAVQGHRGRVELRMSALEGPHPVRTVGPGL